MSNSDQYLNLKFVWYFGLFVRCTQRQALAIYFFIYFWSGLSFKKIRPFGDEVKALEKWNKSPFLK